MPIPTTYSVPGVTNQLKARTIEQILSMGLMGLGAGAAARGLQGGKSMLDRNLATPPKIPNRTVVLPIQVPVRRLDYENEKLGAEKIDYNQRLKALRERRTGKAANAVPPVPAAPKPSFLSPIAEGIGKATGIFAPTNAAGQELGRGGILGRLAGDNAASFAEQPWAWPASAALIGGGLYGGYKMVDGLMDAARKNETDSELNTAKDQYEQSLLAQYTGKTAGAKDPLDEVFEAFEKTGFINQTMGAALLGGGLLAGLAGKATYDTMSGRSETAALQDAMKMRQMDLYTRSPRPVIAMPVPYVPPEPKKKSPGLLDRVTGKAAAGPPAKSIPKKITTSNAAGSALQRLRQHKMQQQQMMGMRLQQNAGGFSSNDLSGATIPTG